MLIINKGQKRSKRDREAMKGDFFDYTHKEMLEMLVKRSSRREPTAPPYTRRDYLNII